MGQFHLWCKSSGINGLGPDRNLISGNVKYIPLPFMDIGLIHPCADAGVGKRCFASSESVSGWLVANPEAALTCALLQRPL